MGISLKRNTTETFLKLTNLTFAADNLSRLNILMYKEYEEYLLDGGTIGGAGCNRKCPGKK